ncbi:MAG TPA: glucosamine-6-phosphate deaminase [Tepidisphaeraceae bacterium]|jgi:glucosamine-6-phosphate deaminase|nr:glucosamine-6-phosphate deaminase [Tepidisphaeraceae bacterium]
MNTIIESDKITLGKRAASDGASKIRTALSSRGSANIIVATGASQFEMLSSLIHEKDIDWSRVTAFHLDEYVGLPITHPASFRLYLWQRFVSKLPLPLATFHYVNAEKDPQAECQRLGSIIKSHPIDVAFIGIGENAHIAFNDPPADFNTEEPYLVVNLDQACRQQQMGEGWFPTLNDVPAQAISMSPNQIMKSKTIICTVPDQRKAKAVHATLKGPLTNQVPASLLQRHPSTTLYLDTPAASLL